MSCHLSDGRLWLLRDSYAAQTAWATRHVGKELRLSRLGAFDAAPGAIRADAEADAARKAGDHDRAAHHEHLAASYRSLRDFYQQQAQTFAQAMTDRQEWEQATAHSRHLAIAADAELRRRHPDRKIEPLRPTGQGPLRENERDRLHLAPEDELTAAATEVRDLAAHYQAFRTRLDDRQRQMAHSEDLDWVGYCLTALPFRDLRRAPILQPPMPRITPSAEILQLAAEHDIEPEAGS